MTYERAVEIMRAVNERQRQPQQFQERDWYAKARPAEKRTEIYDRDWTGSSAGGRIWGGARWSGGREM